MDGDNKVSSESEDVTEKPKYAIEEGGESMTNGVVKTDEVATDDVLTNSFVYTEKNNGTVEASQAVIQQVDLSGSRKCDLVNSLKRFFSWEGKLISSHPWLVIVLSLALTALGSSGLLLLHQENDSIKLWIPQESDTAVDYRWLWDNHPPEFREHSVILHGQDVLTPEALQEMYRIHKSLWKIRTEKYNKTWENTCFRVPIPKFSQSDVKKKRKRRDFSDDFGDFGDEDDFDAEWEEVAHIDYSVSLYPSPYCDEVSQLPDECFQSSLLELWANNGVFDEESDDNIANLTKQEIIEKVNHYNFSELFMTPKDFRHLLGGVELDEHGRVVAAKATFIRWLGKMNATKALERGGSNTAGTGEILDEETEEFEKELSKVLLESRTELPDQLKLEIKLANSFGEISNAMIYGDMTIIIIGFSIIFMYVQIMLGKFNMVENRMFLAFTGLVSVGMSVGISYGFCSLLGFAYGPLHNMIPFLLLGLGIDDMFVIMQCFNNLSPEESKLKLRDQLGRTMRGAGVAITITSVTDFLAFAIGGSTVLPSLQSFCIYCAVGIIVVYFFQSTWFVAWMSLDQRRISAGRNGTVPCYKHINFTPNSFSNRNLLQSVFKRFSVLLVSWPAKLVVVLVAGGLLALSAWGNVLLRQEFNPLWFLPPSSYLAQWHKVNQLYFPGQGKLVNVFMAELDLPRELDKLDRMHMRLNNRTDIVANVDSWYLRFKDYVNRNFEKDGVKVPDEHLDEEEFRDKLTQFLFSQDGAKDRYLFRFDGDLECGKPSPKPQFSLMQYTHHIMTETSQRISAMNAAKEIIKDGNFSDHVFPMSLGYATWETDEVISWELYRNLLLAICCIFVTTLILLYDLWTSLLVLVCVILTLVNVGGFMHFWGLTIDTVSCSLLIISIGLCVDYPVHIAHAFLSSEGSREARAMSAFSSMGPAVFNGGFSTFLSIVVHIASKSHVFQTFFKIFVMVVTFGLYNGLLLLPVILSVIGPKSYEAQRGGTNYRNNSKTPTHEAVQLIEVKNPILKNAPMGHKR